MTRIAWRICNIIYFRSGVGSTPYNCDQAPQSILGDVTFYLKWKCRKKNPDKAWLFLQSPMDRVGFSVPFQHLHLR